MGSVQRLMLRASDPWRHIEFGAGGATVTASGATVYYRSIFPVDSGTNDGSIVDGGSATLTGSWYFSTAADRADLQVLLSDPLLVESRGLPFTANFNPIMARDAVAFSLNQRMSRHYAPWNGATLAEIYVISDTPSGNVMGIVYDTGMAIPGVTYPGGVPASALGLRTRAWSSGSIAFTATAQNWQSLGTPNIVIPDATVPIDLGVLVDNGTAKFRGLSGGATPGAIALPAAALPIAGGTLPKMMWGCGGAGGLFVPQDQVTEGVAGTGVGTLPCIAARWV